MKKVNLLLAAVVAASVSAPAVADYTPNAYFNGYMRAAAAFDKDGKFNALQTNKLGRLGNESTLYGEFGLGADIAKVDDTVWTVNSMLAVSSSSPNSWVGLGDGDKNGNKDGDIALRQFNVEVKGLFESDKDAKIWVGKKYVQREDIHITDDYYYDISGNGAGIENVSLGAGKFSTAYVQNANNMHNFDVRYSFPLWDGANFQIGNVYSQEKKQNAADQQLNGNMLTLEFSQGFNGGWNKTVFQWKTGGQAGQGSGTAWGGEDGNGYKLYNFGETTIVGDLHMFHVVSYEYTKYDKPWHQDPAEYDPNKKTKEWQVVIRPWYKLTKMTRIYAELGAWGKTTSQNCPLDGSGLEHQNEKAQKITLAYAITPDASSMWSRPEIRFFGTWLHGDTRNNGEKYHNAVVNSYRGGSVDLQFGVQAEAWW